MKDFDKGTKLNWPTSINILQLRNYLLPIDEIVFIEWCLVRYVRSYENYFYCSYQDIGKDIKISRTRLNTIINKYKKIGVINTEIKSHPYVKSKVTYFTLSIQILQKSLNKIIDESSDTYERWFNFLEDIKCYSSDYPIFNACLFGLMGSIAFNADNKEELLFNCEFDKLRKLAYKSIFYELIDVYRQYGTYTFYCFWGYLAENKIYPKSVNEVINEYRNFYYGEKDLNYYFNIGIKTKGDYDSEINFGNTREERIAYQKKKEEVDMITVNEMDTEYDDEDDE